MIYNKFGDNIISEMIISRLNRDFCSFFDISEEKTLIEEWEYLGLRHSESKNYNIINRGLVLAFFEGIGCEYESKLISGICNMINNLPTEEECPDKLKTLYEMRNRLSTELIIQESLFQKKYEVVNYLNKTISKLITKLNELEYGYINHGSLFIDSDNFTIFSTIKEINLLALKDDKFLEFIKKLNSKIEVLKHSLEYRLKVLIYNYESEILDKNFNGLDEVLSFSIITRLTYELDQNDFIKLEVNKWYDRWCDILDCSGTLLGVRKSFIFGFIDKYVSESSIKAINIIHQILNESIPKLEKCDPNLIELYKLRYDIQNISINSFTIRNEDNFNYLSDGYKDIMKIYKEKINIIYKYPIRDKKFVIRDINDSLIKLEKFFQSKDDPNNMCISGYSLKFRAELELILESLNDKICESLTTLINVYEGFDEFQHHCCRNVTQ